MQLLLLNDGGRGSQKENKMFSADSSYEGNIRRSANRRGFLVGITLAELLLLTLFVLLLLLGNFQRQVDRFGGNRQHSEAVSLAEAIAKAKPNQPLSDTWRTLKRNVETLADQPAYLDRWLDEWKEHQFSNTVSEGDKSNNQSNLGELQERLKSLETELSYQRKQTEHLEEALSERSTNSAEMRTRINRLASELATSKPGGLVMCMYEAPLDDRSLRGRSISLGTVYIENDGITMIQKNNGLSHMSVVDFVGSRYDTKEVLTLMKGWQVNRKLTFDEFEYLGAKFVSLGDRESDTRQNCRFGLVYFIDESTPHYVFTDIFLKYFFRQSDISREEYERLLQVQGDR